VHFFPGLFSSDSLLSDLFSVLLSASFPVIFFFSAWFSAIVVWHHPHALFFVRVTVCLAIDEWYCSLFA